MYSALFVIPRPGDEPVRLNARGRQFLNFASESRDTIEGAPVGSYLLIMGQGDAFRFLNRDTGWIEHDVLLAAPRDWENQIEAFILIGWDPVENKNTGSKFIAGGVPQVVDRVFFYEDDHGHFVSMYRLRVSASITLSGIDNFPFDGELFYSLSYDGDELKLEALFPARQRLRTVRKRSVAFSAGLYTPVTVSADSLIAGIPVDQDGVIVMGKGASEEVLGFIQNEEYAYLDDGVFTDAVQVGVIEDFVALRIIENYTPPSLLPDLVLIKEDAFIEPLELRGAVALTQRVTERERWTLVTAPAGWAYKAYIALSERVRGRQAFINLENVWAHDGDNGISLEDYGSSLVLKMKGPSDIIERGFRHMQKQGWIDALFRLGDEFDVTISLDEDGRWRAGTSLWNASNDELTRDGTRRRILLIDDGGEG